MRIAIIPARSGSKRVVNKNAKDFLGTPIIGRVIEVIKQSEIFDRVIVSTDSDELSQLSKKFGAEVPFVRPIELSGDFIGTTEVIAHAVKFLQLDNEASVQVCCVYPTSVLMVAKDLKDSLRLFEENKWKYVFAASSPNSSPFRAFKKLGSGGIEMLFPNHWESRSQDLPDCFVDAGFFYWAAPETWIQGEPIFGPNSTFIQIPEFRALDINTQDDWDQAESIFKIYMSDTSK